MLEYSRDYIRSGLPILLIAHLGNAALRKRSAPANFNKRKIILEHRGNFLCHAPQLLSRSDAPTKI